MGQLLARLQVSWDPIGPKSECQKKSRASTTMTNPLMHHGTTLFIQANSMCIKTLLPVCEVYALALPCVFQFTIRRFKCLWFYKVVMHPRACECFNHSYVEKQWTYEEYRLSTTFEILHLVEKKVRQSSFDETDVCCKFCTMWLGAECLPWQ